MGSHRKSASSADPRGETGSNDPGQRSPHSPRVPSDADPRKLPSLDLLVVAVGDSISRSFNAAGVGDDPRYSWSTGENLISPSGSHLYRLRQLADGIGRKVSLSAVNVAAVGAEVIDDREPPLFQQAREAVTYRPDYVTVLIGANDLCNTELPLDQFASVFRQRAQSALDVLRDGASPAKLVLVSSIPNPRFLKNVKKSGIGSFEEVQCMAAWKLYCGNMENLPPETFDAYWNAANRGLADVVTASGGAFVFDQYAVAQSAFQASEVSDIDCFHPSESGQRKIAEVLWKVAEPYLEKILRTP